MTIPHLGFRPHWTHLSPFSRKRLGPYRDGMLYQMGEAIALKRTIGLVIANFIRDNIICRFRILDNCTQFVNSHIKELCERYESTMSNQLLTILKKMAMLKLLIRHY